MSFISVLSRRRGGESHLHPLLKREVPSDLFNQYTPSLDCPGLFMCPGARIAWRASPARDGRPEHFQVIQCPN